MDNPEHGPKTKTVEKKKTPYVKFADFLRKYRIPVLIVFGIALLAVVSVFIGTVISDSGLKVSTARLEKLEADYLAYSSEQDTVKKADLAKNLNISIDAIISRGSRPFAAQKAMVYKAKLEESGKDWNSAEKDWLTIFTTNPESYLAPIALQGAAGAAEELGAFDRATLHYKRLIDSYPSKAIGIPHAYFALGRIAELSKDYPAALVSYQKIVSSWPESDWTKLATSRIIFMKSHGQSK